MPDPKSAERRGCALGLHWLATPHQQTAHQGTGCQVASVDRWLLIHSLSSLWVQSLDQAKARGSEVRKGLVGRTLTFVVRKRFSFPSFKRPPASPLCLPRIAGALTLHLQG